MAQSKPQRPSILASPEWSKVMEDALIQHLRSRLREKIMKAIEPDLNEVIERAVADLKVGVVNNFDFVRDNLVINIMRGDVQ